ncbi:shikimate kinase [Vermiculatibacterium agrestimuris]|uniref:shikimate kinase n=1 Tax=Vermiculatibacterium agrestimuris TaxID=2941519 RepID=UPI00203DF3C0|nr:shikimate kinase [Vermiculatibacterium agrestimuris]
MKNIILIGMMGCGKTTVGELLAMRLKRTLVDTDKLIEAREGISVAEIFETQGEGYFRSLEMGVAQALSLRDDLIIACGGGLPLQEGAMAALKQSGVVIWLDRDAGDIFDGEDMSGRPLAQAGREAFLERAAQRAPIYEKWADATIHDFTSAVSTAARVKEAVETIASWEENKGGEGI